MKVEATEIHQDESGDKWSVDKRIPLIWILTSGAGLILQTVVLVIFLTGMRFDINENAKHIAINDKYDEVVLKQEALIEDMSHRITALETYQTTVMSGPSGMMDRMTRVEEQQKSAQQSLNRIESKLDTPTTISTANHERPSR